MLNEFFLNSTLRKWVFFLHIVLSAVLYYFIFEGGPVGYWDTYVIAPARFLIHEPIIFLDNTGKPQYEGYTLSGKLPDDLVNNKYYGIITKDQRLGAGVIYSLALLMFGAHGMIFYFVLERILIVVFSYFFACRFFKQIVAAYFFCWLSAFNPFLLNIKRINPTILSYLLIFVIAYLLTEKNKNWLLAGVLFGISINIRNILIVMYPGILLCTVFTEKRYIKAAIVFALAAFIMTVPYLYWNSFAFHNPITHSSQYKDFDGFRPVFEHSLFGKKFLFNGLLNYPFYTRLVRTPHFPFPMYLSLILITLRTYGIVLILFFCAGIFSAGLKKSFSAAVVFLPVLMIMLPMENWDELKTTYILLYFPGISLFAAEGMRTFRQYKKRNSALCAGILITLFVMIKFLNGWNVPVDTRWYERFPKALLSNELLSDSEREEWYYFHRQEFPEEYEYQKRKLLDIKLYPRPYFPVKFFRTKLCAETPVIVDVWSNIYGE